jgi:hypothetical protein
MVGGAGKQAVGARGGILGTQKRLAEITEMIHTVSAVETMHISIKMCYIYIYIYIYIYTDMELKGVSYIYVYT